MQYFKLEDANVLTRLNRAIAILQDPESSIETLQATHDNLKNWHWAFHGGRFAERWCTNCAVAPIIRDLKRKIDNYVLQP
jgi:hypothetical protein